MQLDHVFRRLDLSKLSPNERDRYIANIAKVAGVIRSALHPCHEAGAD